MSRLNFNFLCFIIFQACFGTVGNGVWDRYVSVILCVLALFLLFIQTKFEFCRYYKKINWLIFLYCAYNSIISAIGASADLSELQGIAVNLTKDFEPVSKFVGISFGLKIFVLFLLIEFACTKNLLGILIRNFLILFCLLLLVNDFLMLIKGVSDDGSGYLLGNKFQVSYMHFWLLMLFYAKNIYYHTLHFYIIYFVYFIGYLFVFFLCFWWCVGK